MKKLLIKFNFQDSYICTSKTKHETTRIYQTGLKNTNTEIKKSETQNSIKNFAPHPQKRG